MLPAICQKPRPPFSRIHAPAPTEDPAYHGPDGPDGPAGICPSMTLGLGLFLTARKRPIRAGHFPGSIEDDSTESCSGHTLTTVYLILLANFILSCMPRVYHSRLRKCPSPK